MNLLPIKTVEGGLKIGLHKAARPSGSMDSSNPRRWMGVGGSTSMVVVSGMCLCCVLQSHLVVVTRCM